MPPCSDSRCPPATPAGSGASGVRPPPGGSVALGCSRHLLRHLRGRAKGQGHEELRPPLGMVAGLDPPAVRGDDTLADGQAPARSWSAGSRLAPDEFLENAFFFT